MKTLKFTLLISILAISSSTFATSGRKEPPAPPTLLEEIIEIFTVKQK